MTYQPPQNSPYQGYRQPAYLTSPQYTPGPPPTNAAAVIGFIGVFFISLLGIILGHVALSQIKRRGESGRGFAIAALILGYLRFAAEFVLLLFMIFWIGAFGALYSSAI